MTVYISSFELQLSYVAIRGASKMEVWGHMAIHKHVEMLSSQLQIPMSVLLHNSYAACTVTSQG